MAVLEDILALIVTLGILVTVHEFGHFWVARRCGVKVLRFSVGFGQALYRRKDKHGTEFVIAAIPLGGYVKMLDEREGEVATHELHRAFNRKPVWQRIAVVAAGPLANFIFAIFAYWLMFMTGVTQVKPIVGEIDPESLAGQAGLHSQQQITAVDQVPVQSWSEVTYQLVNRLGETGTIEIETDQKNKHELAINRWQADADAPEILGSLGINVYRPSIPPIIAELQPGNPAEQAGIKADDHITAIDGNPVEHWHEVVSVIQASANQPLNLSILRNNEPIELTLIPKQREVNGEVSGFAGAIVKSPKLPSDFYQIRQLGPLDALASGVERTWSMSVMTLESIGKMLQGLMSVKNLSGPITIAQVASDQAKAGLEAFLSFLAYVSIMLGVVNLLPIPVLDGGHLLYYLIEAVRGKPVSEKVQMMGIKVGMALLLGVMMLAIFNDISRL